MVGSVCVEVSIIGVEAVVASEVDDSRAAGCELVTDLPGQTVRQGEEGDVDVRDVVEVVRAERSFAGPEMRVHLGQQAALFAVRSEMDQVELGMVVDEPHDLSPGVAGCSDDCNGETHVGQYTIEQSYAHMRIELGSCHRPSTTVDRE